MLEIKNPDQKIKDDEQALVAKQLQAYDPIARIIVIGVGGAGNNALNRMVEDKVQGVEFVAINTDKQDLLYSKANKKIAIGEKLTGGRGCGAIPEIGEGAANESKELIRSLLRETPNQKKADMVFITCGMGGGTGTGAAPVIANIAKEEGVLTVAVVTKPFRFEGRTRMNRAIAGINKLFPNVDTLITIPNDKLFAVVEAKDGFKESFAKADEVLKQSIRGITDLVNLPALVNLDFADIATVMRNKGLAHIAIGDGKGEDRVIQAIKKAIESPLLETSFEGATDLIVCISGKVSLLDVDAAMREIEPRLSPEANIIFGAREDEVGKDSVSVTLIATGINSNLEEKNDKQMMNNTFMNDFVHDYNNRNYQRPNMNYNPNMGSMSSQGMMNQEMMNQNSMQNVNNAKASFTDFFSNKQDAMPMNKFEDNNSQADSDFKNIDNINLDFGKLGFTKKNNENVSSLLPNFLTDNLKNHK